MTKVYKCNNCGVEYYEDHSQCPFCREPIKNAKCIGFAGMIDESADTYQETPCDETTKCDNHHQSQPRQWDTETGTTEIKTLPKISFNIFLTIFCFFPPAAIFYVYCHFKYFRKDEWTLAEKIALAIFLLINILSLLVWACMILFSVVHMVAPMFLG